MRLLYGLIFFLPHVYTQTNFDLIIRTQNMTNSTIDCINNCINPSSFSIEEIIIRLVLTFILLCISALLAGLTLGLLGLDTFTLEIVAESGDEYDSKYAKRILPIRRKGNYLLCTLILTNVAVNSAISILFDTLLPSAVAFVVSTFGITIFGEIIPQALCSKYALFIGANSTSAIYLFMILLFPIAYPLSLILDFLLGEEIGNVYSNEELKKLIEIHFLSKESGLQDIEAKILGGALDFAKKTVNDIMTSIDDVYMLEVSLKLDADLISDIWQHGKSRIPVYSGSKDNIVGIIIVKDLILVDEEDELPLETILHFYGRQVIKVFPDMHLDEILKIFKSGKSHMAIVHDVVSENNKDPYYITVGMITLEDVINEILKTNITEVNQDLDVQMMKSIKNTKIQRLTPQNLIAVESYLTKSYPIFKVIPEEYLYILLNKAEVQTFIESHQIFQKGKYYNHFIIILSGKVLVESGKDQFTTEKGPWNSLGLRGITHPKFICDFNAKVIKETKVCIIHQRDFINIFKILIEKEKIILPIALDWMQEKSN